MRQNRANSCGDRSNALWGRGSRGEARSNALWGRGGRRAGAVVAMVATAFVMAAAATAGSLNKTDSSGADASGLKAYVQDTLLSAVQQNPKQAFDVIVEGADRTAPSHGLVLKMLGDQSGTADETIGQGNVKKEFLSIDGAQLTLTGKQILHLGRSGIASAILPNETVKQSGVSLGTYNPQMWAWTIGAPVDWVNGTPKAPTIAIVDSGIDPAHTADFGNRVIGQVNRSSLTPNSSGDGYGHGTFVAAIAADGANGYAGTAPTANLISVDVMNDQGAGTEADVISGADWILQNKTTYNIKVANFSLHTSNRASVMFDPLDQAVERLWLNGVVVVTASGNYAVDGAPSGVQYAPGNDPFVITVGAADTMGTLSQTDDTAAPWSAWGYTGDGFMKPDVSAPGRYMIAPVTVGGGLALERPDHVVSPGYMQLSGTSFAAPVVSGIAAMLVAQHPTWTPGQIKGAIMLTSVPTKSTAVAPGQLGVGEVNVASARAYSATPPNPNVGLNQFLTTATDGSRVFNAAAWKSAAKSNAAWDSAAWSDAAWSSAAWASAAWSDAAWSDAAWASAAWSDAAWSDAAWSDAAWSDAAWSDGALGDAIRSSVQLTADSATQASVDAALGINP
jgi:serine protease AprX